MNREGARGVLANGGCGGLVGAGQAVGKVHTAGTRRLCYGPWDNGSVPECGQRWNNQQQECSGSNCESIQIWVLVGKQLTVCGRGHVS